MIISNYKKSIFSKRMLFHTFKRFSVIFGSVSAVVGLVAALDPSVVQYGLPAFLGLTGLILLLSFILELPKRTISHSFSHPDMRITVKVGNILEQREHLVIGFSDTFDTEIGEIINANSLQGKFLSSLYNYDRTRLDRDLDLALQGENFEVDSTKTVGKNKRYKIGTTVAIPGENRKFFCCAYSYMKSDLRATSDIDNLWISLQAIWAKVRHDGEQKAIVMPVIGTNLARVPGISFTLPLKLILLSFLVNSRIECISKELVIVIREEDVDKVNLLEVEDYIKSLQN